MALPPVLPPPPPYTEPNVLHTNKLLVEGYNAALGVLAITQPDLHQVRYHREQIWSELVPLLDVVLKSTSDAATCSWCHATTITIADLFNRLTESEAVAQHRSAITHAFIDSHNGC